MKGLKERAFLLHLKEREFGYNGKKNLHQVLLEWMRKICLSHVDPNTFQLEIL
ncbi:hypothetical protein HMPREF1423_01267 [Helicobacter pylori GAM270ASi]|nr:hypothetical protein HMPREF1423_01267 [Helicobacter pylori GAM270ASi]